MFKIRRGPLRMYDYNDNVQLAVTYELNRDLRIVRRSVYSFLDLLGELGGLAGALHAFFSVTIIILQFRAVTSYLSQHLYLIREGDDKEDNAAAANKKDKTAASDEISDGLGGGLGALGALGADKQIGGGSS